jgi:hypothetical protein
MLWFDRDPTVQLYLTKYRRREQRMAAEVHRKLTGESPEFARGLAGTCR